MVSSTGVSLTERCQAVIEDMRERGQSFAQFIHDEMRYELKLGETGEAVYLNQAGAVIDKFSLRGVRIGACTCGKSGEHTHIKIA